MDLVNAIALALGTAAAVGVSIVGFLQYRLSKEVRTKRLPRLELVAQAHNIDIRPLLVTGSSQHSEARDTRIVAEADLLVTNKSERPNSVTEVWLELESPPDEPRRWLHRIPVSKHLMQTSHDKFGAPLPLPCNLQAGTSAMGFVAFDVVLPAKEIDEDAYSYTFRAKDGHGQQYEATFL